MKEAKKQTSFVTEIEFDKEKKKKKCKERKEGLNEQSLGEEMNANNGRLRKERFEKERKCVGKNG